MDGKLTIALDVGEYGSEVANRLLAEGRDVDTVRKELADRYTRENVNPYLSVARGELDAIITPETTRSSIVSALRILRTKDRSHPGSRRHGNMPM